MQLHTNYTQKMHRCKVITYLKVFCWFENKVFKILLLCLLVAKCCSYTKKKIVAYKDSELNYCKYNLQ